MMAPHDNYQRVSHISGAAGGATAGGIVNFLDDVNGDTTKNFYLNNGYPTTNSTNRIGLTMDDIQLMVSQVLNGSYENLSSELTDWQKAKLESLNGVASGISCYLKNWLIEEKKLEAGLEYIQNSRSKTFSILCTFCNATWDNFYCWPPTPNGVVLSHECSEVLQETQGDHAKHIQGNAFRVCLENSTWLRGNWTNYTECADSYDEYVRTTAEERSLVVAVQFILFIGSILSILCLGSALAIFYYFKCLRCDRVTVHIHLMLALLLRSIFLIIITEPFIFNRTDHYRTVDIACKVVLSVNLYATVASINWMFIQGVYLHGKLTTNVFDRETPFKVYYTIGWVLPLALIIVYVIVMETTYPVQCWKDYSERDEIWILLAPMIFCLFVNFFFLINIMRILLTTVQRTNSLSDAAQFKRAVKATVVLFPLLGMNNILFLYNPGGDFNKYFVILNTLFGSTQGISVAILYCFVSKDVRDAIRREYRRYAARRNANSVRHSHSSGRSRNNRSTVAGQPSSIIRTRTHFRTKLKSLRNRDEVSASPDRDSQSLETANTVTRNETPSPPPPYFRSSGYRNEHGNNNNHNSHDPTVLQTNTTTAIIESIMSEEDNQYTVTIPLKEIL